MYEWARRAFHNSDLAHALAAALPRQDRATALEIGCGTGTLALALAGCFEHICATDASLGMIEQLRLKLAKTPVAQIEPVHVDFLTASPAHERYDFVYSAMALHHVEEAARLVAIMAALVRAGGTPDPNVRKVRHRQHPLCRFRGALDAGASGSYARLRREVECQCPSET